MRPRGFVPEDTTPEAWEAQAEAYRRMGPRARTAVVFRLNDLARQVARAGIRSRHPEYSEDDVRRAWFRLKLGDDLARAVWPDRHLVDP